jgi:hypothetical protein
MRTEVSGGQSEVRGTVGVLAYDSGDVRDGRPLSHDGSELTSLWIETEAAPRAGAIPMPGNASVCMSRIAADSSGMVWVGSAAMVESGPSECTRPPCLRTEGSGASPCSWIGTPDQSSSVAR